MARGPPTLLRPDLQFFFYGSNIRVYPARWPHIFLSLREERQLSLSRCVCAVAPHGVSAGEDGLAAYHIRFMKRLNTRWERATKSCVWSVNIRFARDPIRAALAAKRRFERLAGVANWRWKADYISVDERPLSDEKAQDVGQWPPYLKSRMDIMQKNIAVGNPRNPKVPARREMGRKAEEPAYVVHVRTPPVTSAATIQPIISADLLAYLITRNLGQMASPRKILRAFAPLP